MLGTGGRLASGRSIKNQIIGRAERDRDAGFADASKAKALFAWEAKSDINGMCVELWRFNEQNPRGL
jgi:UDP-glucose 4-epimerase